MSDSPRIELVEENREHSAAANALNNQVERDPNKRPRGRPIAKTIDLSELEKLASIQCTDDEIADFFNMDRRTLTRKKKQVEVRNAIERGKAKGRISVRRRLFQIAQSDKAGSVAAAIFLGKALLGYRDRDVSAPVSESEGQNKLTSEEAVRKIRDLYDLNDPLEPKNNTAAPTADAVITAPKDSSESATSNDGQSSTQGAAEPPKVDSGLIQAPPTYSEVIEVRIPMEIKGNGYIQ